MKQYNVLCISSRVFTLTLDEVASIMEDLWEIVFKRLCKQDSY